ncbi:DsbA family protein [Vibrio astriarenae]|uniref:DsbA family protein n=1 Tax=Vibrio astriarenae TaxID=1481923 RepID=A0A7Z2YFG5_9VIBR|nr:DsbA family protein [Vibrio astriarenae]QIA65164.1 DsbA family protein [Vibrio astriarenae]
MSEKRKLYYVYDPMCSWCWGFKPTWKQLEQKLQNHVEIQYVVGGLAPDTQDPMPVLMREQIASYWHKIEGLLGTQFNHDFWKNNEPRRSTYPSCRAMLLAREKGLEKQMLSRVQEAYYLEAKNPSEHIVLATLAQEIGFDFDLFLSDLESTTVDEALLEELKFARGIGGNSFPSLFIETSEGVVEIPVDYQDSESMFTKINSLL